jgi:hypothetical protein
MNEEFGAWLATLDEDHFITANQFTDSYYRDEYAAIKPEDARLSQEGKVIVITGASAGLGQKVLYEFPCFVVRCAAFTEITSFRR